MTPQASHGEEVISEELSPPHWAKSILLQQLIALQLLLKKVGAPSHQRFPADAVRKLPCFLQANQGLGQRTDTLVQSALQPSQARPWGRRDKLVDGWEGNKAFFLSTGGVGPPTSRMWFLFNPRILLSWG